MALRLRICLRARVVTRAHNRQIAGGSEAVCPQGIGRCAGRIGVADSPRHTSFPSQCR